MERCSAPRLLWWAWSLTVGLFLGLHMAGTSRMLRPFTQILENRSKRISSCGLWGVTFAKAAEGPLDTKGADEWQEELRAITDTLTAIGIPAEQAATAQVLFIMDLSRKGDASAKGRGGSATGGNSAAGGDSATGDDSAIGGRVKEKERSKSSAECGQREDTASLDSWMSAAAHRQKLILESCYPIIYSFAMERSLQNDLDDDHSALLAAAKDELFARALNTLKHVKPARRTPDMMTKMSELLLELEAAIKLLVRLDGDPTRQATAVKAALENFVQFCRPILKAILFCMTCFRRFHRERLLFFFYVQAVLPRMLEGLLMLYRMRRYLEACSSSQAPQALRDRVTPYMDAATRLLKLPNELSYVLLGIASGCRAGASRALQEAYATAFLDYEKDETFFARYGRFFRTPEKTSKSKSNSQHQKEGRQKWDAGSFQKEGEQEGDAGSSQEKGHEEEEGSLQERGQHTGDAGSSQNAGEEEREVGSSHAPSTNGGARRRTPRLLPKPKGDEGGSKETGPSRFELDAGLFLRMVTEHLRLVQECDKVLRRQMTQ